jgi:hypothetical protein
LAVADDALDWPGTGTYRTPSLAPGDWCPTITDMCSMGRSARPPEQIEQMRRSIALLTPGSMAVGREDALQLMGELGDVHRRLDRLRQGLRELLREET